MDPTTGNEHKSKLSFEIVLEDPTIDASETSSTPKPRASRKPMSATSRSGVSKLVKIGMSL
jgi:hypothetical protein